MSNCIIHTRIYIHKRSDVYVLYGDIAITIQELGSVYIRGVDGARVLQLALENGTLVPFS